MDAVKTFFLVSEMWSEDEEHTPSRLATMVTNPVPAPSSSTSFPCMSTLSLLLSRKEDRANACGTSRGTVSPCVCVHLRQQVSRGTHSGPHHCSEVIDGLVDDDVVTCVVVGVSPKAAPGTRHPGWFAGRLHGCRLESCLF